MKHLRAKFKDMLKILYYCRNCYKTVGGCLPNDAIHMKWYEFQEGGTCYMLEWSWTVLAKKGNNWSF